MKIHNLLALDFDGVIADSIDECLVTAYNAFTHGTDAYVPRMGLSGFSKGEILEFRNLRPLIRRGEDYVFIMLAMSEKKRFLSQQEFDDFLESNEFRREEYRLLFYSERESIQTQNTEQWLKLNTLYPGMAAFLKSADADKLFIVTTKDLGSVQLILEHNGIKLRSDHMFQADKALRKPAILNDILSKTDAATEQIHFIDDHVDTVIEVKINSPAHVYCAAWGYNTADQHNILLQHQISAISLDKFLAKSW
jgi:FMN phosphatase YigB (HAD superfamily)